MVEICPKFGYENLSETFSAEMEFIKSIPGIFNTGYSTIEKRGGPIFGNLTSSQNDTSSRHKATYQF
jgi:hypothetical protein